MLSCGVRPLHVCLVVCVCARQGGEEALFGRNSHWSSLTGVCVGGCGCGCVCGLKGMEVCLEGRRHSGVWQFYKGLLQIWALWSWVMCERRVSSVVCVYNVGVTHRKHLKHLSCSWACDKAAIGELIAAAMWTICVFMLQRKCFRCGLQAVEPCSSLGPIPTGTLCQIERPSADRPRSSLDRVCVCVCACRPVCDCMVMHVCDCVY